MAFNKNKVMDSARKAYDKKQYDKAVKEYLKIVKQDPKDVRIWLKIGDLYAKKGSKPEATETYERVAKFYSDQGFYQKAVAVYKQILKLDPKQVPVNLKLAELYRQLGLRSEASQHYELVAAYFHREGNTQEALSTIRQLVELDPENVSTRIKLAELYSKESMNDEAIVEFKFACEFLREHNRQDDFIKVAERLLFHDTANLELSRELAGLYLRRNDPRRALAKLQVCFKQDPKDLDTLALLAQAFQKLDQKGKTVSVLKELASILLEKDKKKKARDVHKKILEFVPDDPESLAFLGRKSPSAQALPVEASQVSGVRFTPPKDGVEDSVMDSLKSVTSEIPVAAPQAFAEDLDQSQFDDMVEGATVEGEANSDEITKILNETDVYIKYGLHQKAIDHLDRVFLLDRDNVEAHERLKNIYQGQERIQDVIAELLTLARVVGPRNSKRATKYVREILEIEPENQKALDIADKFGLSLSSPSSMPAPPKSKEASQELNFDDLNFSEDTNSEKLIGAVDGDDYDLDDGIEFDYDPSVVEQIEDLSELEFEEIEEDDPSFDPIDAAEFDSKVPVVTDSSEDLKLANESYEPLPTELEDELEEADFFIEQGMVDEAKDVLKGILAKKPNHPLIVGKLAELDPPEDTASSQSAKAPTSSSSPSTSIKLETELNETDADTRYDLALAYKEMGLYDEAIEALEKVRIVPGREIPCLLVVGACHREDGQCNKAIEILKAGLYSEELSDGQKLDLYYELGLTYEVLEDNKEALYYFEMIEKKDSSYRDVKTKMSAIQNNQNGEDSNPFAEATNSGDVDDVLDNLFGDSD